MKLIDALETLKRPAPDAAPDAGVFLACGFTPLHLKTFLTAQLRILRPNHRVEVTTGLFGDLIGNIERLNPAGRDSLAVVIEWADLDSRLAVRNLGGWRLSNLPDIVGSVDQAAARIQEILLRVSRCIPTVVCLPTLPLPPMFSTRPDQSASCELHLRHRVASLAAALSGEAGIRIVNAQFLDQISPLDGRFDIKSEIITGFPYSLSHASMLGMAVARLIHNQPPKKGLITDLDDTLWSGILGEVGINGISWDLDHRTHMHGLYQQFVASLASAGVLVGVASKNDPAMVEQAFSQKDLHITKDDIFPLEINWNRKSDSVKRILETWNINPESVVFVDDSPMEVAEVKARFPELECIVFPNRDQQGIWNLLGHLRGVFGKPAVTAEDSIRLSSIRNGVAWRHEMQSSSGTSDEFLQCAESSIAFRCTRESQDPRAFELLNKTNQFNLNGKRFSESEWLSYFSDPTAFLLTATYQDKYGPLGKVAVIVGKTGNRTLKVNAWVMSCRAFSRRIEHQCIKYLFATFEPDEIVFDYEETSRNYPLRDFFAGLFGGAPCQVITLSKELFERNVPLLFHRVKGELHV